MQLNPNRTFRLLMTIVVAGGLLLGEVRGQDGAIIINEFNPEKGCPQYIELKNLGPGRQNIGCYKLANESFAITIPPNTFLEPGKTYLIAGVNLITCGKAINKTVNLNWTSCANCTSSPLIGEEAFFGNWSNGSISYPLVLYDNNNSIRDAVRTAGNSLPTLTTLTSTSAVSSGTGCATTTLNLPTDITEGTTVYEFINQNLGANASLSRSGDGSCTWFKATSDKRTPGLDNEVESGTPAVGATSQYSLTCLTATSSYTSTLTINVTSTPYWYQFVFFPNSNLSNGTTPVSFSNQTSSQIVTNNPAPGIYSYLFAPSATSTCGQTAHIVQVIDPIMTVSPTYTVDCLGGIADLKITNVGATNTMAPVYFPISYAVSSSTNTFTASGSTTTPDVVRISQIPVGTYTATLTPASQFACPKAIGFNITTQPLTVLSATVSTTAACSDQTTDGFATLSLTNNDLNLYYPIDFTLNKTNGGVTSFVSTGTFSEQTKTFSGLTSGTYQVILDPQADGCLASSSFTINVSSTDCSLQEILKNFSAKSSGAFIEFNFKLDAGGILKDIYLESSEDGKTFVKVTDITFENKKGFQDISLSIPASQQTFFRLNITDIYSKKLLSPVLRVNSGATIKGLIVYPNPFEDQINLSVSSAKDDIFLICIMAASGAVVHEEQCKINKGIKSIQLSTSKLAKGVYFLCTQKVSTGERQVTRVLKQ